MQAGMQELRALGMRGATLWVLRDNLRARRFYEHLGWAPDGRTASEDYGGRRLEALCYRRSEVVWNVQLIPEPKDEII
jgi:hypothetical protein